MEKIKRLQLNKLISELEFIRSDYEYKSEIIQNADREFIESVIEIVDGHPELKKIYDSKFKKDENSEFVKERVSEDEIIQDIKEQIQEKDPKIKNIYRTIVKKTHPDKIDDPKLNEIYLEATKNYEEDDILSLYKICDKLEIPYDLEESDYSLIACKINELKEKINFLESTFTWLWINSNGSKKEEIIINFLRLQINQI